MFRFILCPQTGPVILVLQGEFGPGPRVTSICCSGRSVNVFGLRESGWFQDTKTMSSESLGEEREWK